MSYAEATSCAQGETLRFHGSGPVTVQDMPSGRTVLRADAEGPTWTLDVGEDWPSSLYRAVFADGAVYFAVRAAVQTSAVLVSIPFPTWEAYNRAGVPGEGLYQAEQPDRAVRVRFDRPGGGPQREQWELGLLRWLGPAGYAVDYCSGLDLHDGLDLLSRYRLLVINGHDEYWSKEMRDAVEEFVRRGGNLAIFSGNTCWWQVRFEDDLRTMVCYRDAAADPLSVSDPGRVTVEWPSEPVNRPESTLTGLTYRHGAGCWVDSRVMATEEYTTRFADHWVFEGTGLRDGDAFGRGAIGYETDAAELTWARGIPRASSPPSLVVLATADLSHWSRYGKAGAATMAIHRLGAGTVFNAGTINWGNTLGDAALARITRNVLTHLSAPPARERWEPIGSAPGRRDAIASAPEVLALVACEGVLFASCADGTLRARDLCGQNLRWDVVGPSDVVALAAPREAYVGAPTGLYGVAADGTLRYREAVLTRPDWHDVGQVPAGTVGLAAVNGGLFAVADDALWHLPVAELGAGTWSVVGSAAGATCLTAMNGRLYALSNDRVITRTAVRHEAGWADLGSAGGCTVLAAEGGRLVGAVSGGRLYWRSLS